MNTTISSVSAPPAAWSLESEKSLIAAALTESRATVMRELSSQVVSTDFFEETHQNIWRCYSSLADAGVANDVAAVLDSAKRLGLFVGGVEYLLGLVRDDTLASSSDLALRASAKRVKDFSILRTFTDTLKTATTLAESGSQGHEEVISYVSDALENIRSMTSVRSTGPLHIMHYVAAATEQTEMRLDGNAPLNAVTSGFHNMDNMTSGFADGDLIILAARPSMGKTALALALSKNAAKDQSNPRAVLIFSTEQGGLQLAYRFIASEARIDATNLRRAELHDGDFDRMIDGARTVSDLDIYVDDTSEISLPEIRARSRIFAQQQAKLGKKPLILVDYLQRLKAHKQAEPRIIIGEISTGFKNLAKELLCPVIALAQLSRTVETRTNKRPMMSDLAESGKIEQDADIIMFLYRDEYYNPDTKDPGVTEVIVAKNRDGAVGVCKLSFNKRTQAFEEMTNYD